MEGPPAYLFGVAALTVVLGVALLVNPLPFVRRAHEAAAASHGTGFLARFNRKAWAPEKETEQVRTLRIVGALWIVFGLSMGILGYAARMAAG